MCAEGEMQHKDYKDSKQDGSVTTVGSEVKFDVVRQLEIDSPFASHQGNDSQTKKNQ